MTKLEFINKEIEYYKQKKDKIIERYAYLIEHNGNYIQIKKAEKEKDAINNYIDNLLQIKNVLEAWEVIAPALIEGKLVGLSYFLKNDIEKFNTIKKALEIEE